MLVFESMACLQIDQSAVVAIRLVQVRYRLCIFSDLSID
jgi:hypothetical protein